jgi:hypothetical protein
MPGLAARAQQEGPVLVTQRADLELFQLQALNLALEVEWRRDVDKFDPRGGSSQRDVEERLEEFLDVDALAFVGHPNLLELSLDGRFGLRQRRIDLESTSSERIDDTLINYDFSALFLKNTRNPFTLYLRQAETDVNRQFAGDLTDDRTQYGARLVVRDEVTPLRAEVYRREVEQRDRANQDEFTIDETTVLLDGQVEMKSAGTLWWDYTFNDIDQSGRIRTSRTFDRHEANATYTLDFGPEEKHHLRSTFRWYKESSELDLEQLRLNNRLRWQHSMDLRSTIDYTEERLDRRDSDERNREYIYTLHHQLFESLTTVAEAGGRRIKIPTDDFISDEYFGRVSFDYTKKVPLGRVYAGAQIGRSRVDASDRGTTIQVIDDVRTFDATDLIVIDRQNIIASSIVITDVTGIITYTENIDYSVLAFPDSVEIRRLITGAIAPGQTVLIDYEIGPQPGGVTTTDVYSVVARYTFDEGWLRGLSPYIRYIDQEESRSFDPTNAAFAANDFTSFTYGVEYNIWKISLLAEQEIRDSSLSPFDRTRLEGRYVDRFGRGNVLILTGQFQEIDRTDDNIRTTTTVLSSELGTQLTQRLRGSLLLQYRIEDDNSDFDSQAFEQEFRLRWEYGQTSIFTRIRNSYIDSSQDDTSFQTFVVGVRREF